MSKLRQGLNETRFLESMVFQDLKVPLRKNFFEKDIVKIILFLRNSFFSLARSTCNFFLQNDNSDEFLVLERRRKSRRF